MRVGLFFSVVVCSLVVGCAVPDYNHRAQLVRVDVPPLGVVHTSYVGDVMLRKGRYHQVDALYLDRVVGVSWAFDLHPGYYVKQGEDASTETFLPEDGELGGSIQKAVMADNWQAIMLYKGTSRLCVITFSGSYVCNDNAPFERTVRPVSGGDSFQQTLIYSGKVGGKINVGYREFSNSLARPAFNNDVEYDLAESVVIGYKGAKLEVLEATNELIRYKVLSSFRAVGL